eukprot:s1755_g1.t3
MRNVSYEEPGDINAAQAQAQVQAQAQLSQAPPPPVGFGQDQGGQALVQAHTASLAELQAQAQAHAQAQVHAAEAAARFAQEQAQAVAEAQQRAVVQAQAQAAAEQARLQQQQQQQQREQAIAQAKQRREEKLKEAQMEKEAEEKLRCHLHKKPNSKCKFCKRHQDHVAERDERKAAAAKGAEKDKRLDFSNIPRGALEIVSTKTYGFSPLLQTHVVESAHFKALLSLESFDQMIEEMNQFADNIEPYMPNSNTTPSALFCCLYRLFTMGIDSRQLRRLMDNPDNAYIRCVGFLFVRAWGFGIQNFGVVWGSRLCLPRDGASQRPELAGCLISAAQAQQSIREDHLWPHLLRECTAANGILMLADDAECCAAWLVDLRLGMAFSNDVVFLSHQLQFALLLTVLACYVTHELHRGNGRWAAWITASACFLLIDPLRHVVYDAQFNPAACGPPGSLMSPALPLPCALPCPPCPALWFAAEAASQAAGKPRSQLTVQEVLGEMRRDYSTSRGSQSLDGEALEKAKQQLKQAQKRCFTSILDRFDNDVDFTLHSVAGGFDREFLAVEDVLTHSEESPVLGWGTMVKTMWLWNWLGEYVLDDEELRPAKDSEWRTTIGEFVEGLLSQDKYYSTVLPRLPMSTKRQLEAKLAPIPQSRKRAKSNLAFLEVYREQGVKVEVSYEGDWLTATTLELIEDIPSRLKVLVKMEHDDSEKVFSLGSRYVRRVLEGSRAFYLQSLYIWLKDLRDMCLTLGMLTETVECGFAASKTVSSHTALYKMVGKAGFVPYYPAIFGVNETITAPLRCKTGELSSKTWTMQKVTVRDVPLVVLMHSSTQEDGFEPADLFTA